MKTPTPKQTIKHLMTKYGNYQRIAKATKMSDSTVRRIASGEIRNPSYSTMQKLLKKLFEFCGVYIGNKIICRV